MYEKQKKKKNHLGDRRLSGWKTEYDKAIYHKCMKQPYQKEWERDQLKWPWK